MTGYDTSQFEKDLSALGISLKEPQLEQFLIYYEMLVEWNQKMNLTAITEYDDVMKKHFADSLSLVKAYDPLNSVKLMDVGTGAGFPGLALKIAFPEWEVTLLDSLNKRVQFLNAVIERLELKNVRAIHGRAEDIAKNQEFREQFDLCVSRAVANLSTLCEYCLPFVKVGGSFVSYKSENIADEIQNGKSAIQKLGGKLTDQVSFFLLDSEIARTLVSIRKTAETPPKYPRKAGLPGKDPLK